MEIISEHGDELKCVCPECHHKSYYENQVDGRYYCFKCGYGGVKKGMKKKGKWKPPPIVKVKVPNDLTKAIDSSDAMEYFECRGIKEIHNYPIYYNKGWIYFCDWLDNNRETYFIQSRYTLEKKFRCMKGLTKNLPWLEEGPMPIVLCEGFIDALSIKQVFPKLCVVPIIGKVLSRHQLTLVPKDRRIYVMMDSTNDSVDVWNQVIYSVGNEDSYYIKSEEDPNDLLCEGKLKEIVLASVK